MDQATKKALQIYAAKIRLGIVDSTNSAKSGHPGGSLSSADVFAYLYGKEMRVDPKNPKWADRDRFVLSKGHCAPGLYSALAYKGFFPPEDLTTLRHIGSYLQGHPQYEHGARRGYEHRLSGSGHQRRLRYGQGRQVPGQG